MHDIAGMIVVAVVCIGAGYGFRGLIHKDIAAAGSKVSSSDLKSYAERIESAALNLVTDAKTELLKIASEIRTKI